jgi:hypothetical protein
VLTPGDSFLYPSDTGTDPLSINVQNPREGQDSYTQFSGGDISAQAYGRDIRLESASDADLSTMAISQSGDLDTIVGVANVEQAMKIKFITEQGTLLMHPKFGATYAIGTKADESSFNTFYVNVIATLKSDPRITTVDYARFVVVGDVLALDTRVTLNDTNDFVATNFALRRW